MINANAWYNTGGTWTYRKAITISHTQVAGTAALSNFPVLVSLTDADLAGGARADGGDILFTAADGVTKLSHEIEQYNGSTGKLLAWVGANSLSPVVDTVLYLYYGNATAVSQQNPAGVWDSNYRGVWHLGNGVTVNTADSTADANQGTAANGPAAVAGEISGGVSVNAGSSQAVISNNNAGISGDANYTLSAWIKPNAQSSQGLLGWGNPNGQFAGLFYNLRGTGVVSAEFGNTQPAYAAQNVTAGAWHYVVFAKTPGPVNTTTRLYIDGVDQGAMAAGSSANIVPIADGPMQIGRWGSSNYSSSAFDEVRVSNVARSAAWIATEYNNQSAPGVFLAGGSQQTQNGGTAAVMVTSVPAGLSLTVDGAACTAPCTAQWTVGSDHTIAAATQAGAVGVQYVFASWSDSGAASHTVSGPAGATTYTATFTTQYYLTTGAQQAATIAGCPAFPANNVWNTPVDGLPLDAHSSDYINNISATSGLRYDATMPVNIVPGTQPLVTLNIASPSESDPGPYPIPPNAQVEPGDLHVIVVDKDHCMLYETYNSVLQPDGSWNVDSAAKWDLTSNALRPAGWTSADAAGLPIMPGLLQYDEVASGQIDHALRFTAPSTQAAYVWPGRHRASTNSSTSLPPMGQRFRLQAGFDISGFSPNMQTILRALKKYGLLLADNGLPWFLQAEPDARWNTSELDTLRNVLGANIEAVDSSSMMVGSDSGQAVQPAAGAGGTVSPASGWYDAGTAVSVSATAATYYQFEGFSGALTGSATPQILTMNAPASVFGNFISANTVAVTVTSVPAGLSLTVDGGACTAPCTAQWTPGSGHTIAAATQAGATGVQYVFGNWSDAGAASHTVSGPAGATTYTATFTTQYYLTTGASPSAGGTISPASGWYDAGAVAAVSASAASGYQFTGFSGGLSGTTTPQNLTMNGPASVTAGFAVQGTGAWYGTWGYRKALTISHAQVAGELTNFPVLVSITDGNLGSGAKADGSDILFTAADGVTKLNHEVEEYHSGTGQLVAWVGVPSVSAASDTVIYLYYGNAGAASQQNPAGVWDSNYAGVWHLGDGVTLTAGDGTGNGNNGVVTNAVAAGGEIGGAAGFNGVNSSIHSQSSVGIAGNGSATLEAWVKLASTSGEQNVVAVGAPNVLQEMILDTNVNGAGSVSVEFGSNGMRTVGGKLGVGVWHHLVATKAPGAINATTSLYVDGVAQSFAVTSGNTPNVLNEPVYMGARLDGAYHLNGAIDEVRVSNIARPAAWIATEYNNQSAPGTFLTVGAQEGQGSGTVAVTVTSVPAGLSLTVDGGACTAPCTAQWTPGSEHTIAAATQAGATGVQYVFGNWSDAGAASHTVSGPAGATTYTATFTTQYYLTTGASPSAGGTISPASGWYDAGAVAAVSASAASGYQFTGFSGGLSGTTTPQNLTMNGPASVTAGFAVQGTGAWYGTWGYRKALTISHAQVAGELTNFPVLVSITDGNLGSGAKADGSDILFTAADGVTKLNHEVEEYHSGTGQLVAWVGVPSVSAASDTVIYLYYGNAGAASQQNPAGVWDSNYAGVWHLGDGVTLTAGDGTGNGNNGVVTNAVAAGGEIGGAAGFNGVNSSIHSQSSVGIAGNGSATLEAWVKLASTSGEQNVVAVGAPNVLQEMILDTNVNGAGSVSVEFGSNGMRTVGGKLGVGVWHHLVATKAPGAINATTSLYVDGVAQSFAVTSGNTPNVLNEPVYMGARLDGAYHLNGAIDEVRVSNIARPAAWIATEYNNQSAPGTFLTVGAQEGQGSGTVAVTVTSVPAGLSLTVDGGACTAPCTAQWTPGSEHTIAAATQAGATGVQYVFGNWSDAGAASHTVSGPAGATTYTATFTTQYYLTTGASPSAGGTISPASGWYDAGAVAAVSASAASGYQFTGFSGGLSGTTTPQNLTMNGPASVTAGFAVQGTGAWYGTWGYRKALTISHAQVAGELTNFPVLVSITDGNLGSGAKADGSDILFTAADGVTKLNHEVEEYHSGTGQLVAWVGVPSVSAASDTVIYLYYGNAGAASQQNPAGVWDSNYAGVWHLGDGVTLTAGDGTGNGNNGVVTNAVAAGGEIGGAAGFNGVNSSIHSQSSVGIAGNGSATLEAWVKLASTSGEQNVVAVGAPNVLQEMILDTNVNGAGSVSVEFGSNGMRTVGGKLGVGVWHHLVATKAPGAINATTSLYVDGVAQSFAVTSGNTPNVLNEPVYMGARLDGAYHLNGAIDEVRVSNIARPAAWITTEYNNQSAPGTFLTVGAQEALNGSAGTR